MPEFFARRAATASANTFFLHSRYAVKKLLHSSLCVLFFSKQASDAALASAQSESFSKSVRPVSCLPIRAILECRLYKKQRQGMQVGVRCELPVDR